MRAASGTLRGQPGLAYYGLLLTSSLGSCAAYVALLLGQARYADVVALSRIPYHEWGYRLWPVRLSAAGLLAAQRGFLAGALILLTGGATLALSADGRHEWRQLGRELQLASRQRLLGWRQLPPSARWAAGGTLLLLTAARLALSVYSPFGTDELATYDFFSSRSWLASASFYPIPNNHLLLSVLGHAVYLLTPGYWVVLRLPVLLAATAATVGLFGGLLRVGSFRVALLTLTLFCFTDVALRYAADGRGYWLLTGWAGLCLLAVLALVRPRPRARLGGCLLLLSCLLGCYTVPSFAYVAASAFSYLAVVAGGRRAWQQLGQIALLGLGTGLGVAILYAPVGLVSGWAALLHNYYTAAQPRAYVWQHLPWFGWHTEGSLLGFERLGMVAVLLALAGLAWHRWPPRWQRLPAAVRARLGYLAGPALWFMGLPYLLQLAQQVEAPLRVLLYKGLFSALLLSLLAEAWLLARPSRWLAPALWATLLGLGGYHTAALLREAYHARQVVATYHESLAWLLRQPPGPVLIQPHRTALYWLVLGHRQVAAQPFPLATTPRAGVRYRYVVVATGSAADSRLALAGQPAYRDAVQSVYSTRR